MNKLLLLVLIIIFICSNLFSARMLVHMDHSQSDHLRAYGLAYWVLSQGQKIEWLLNYRNGSFLMPDYEPIQQKANLMGVRYTIISDQQVAGIYEIIETANMEVCLLEKAPKVAVYSPPEADPWDDAVTLAFNYAMIPYDKIYDREILSKKLDDFDWLHLHHEDFTGQYGKFYLSFNNAPWYQKKVLNFKKMAQELGFATVAEEKLAVAKTIKSFVGKGGFLFTMCSATDSFDIALAAEGIDIILPQIDGTPMDPNAQKKLDFSKCIAFENFNISQTLEYEFSDIDADPRLFSENAFRGDFSLFEFSAKYDRTSTILTQNHENIISGFMGQTTAFQRKYIKKDIKILGSINDDLVKYIHGNFGEGSFSFFSGHDPEDFAHYVGEAPTNMSLHKNSPGFRLILNNLLFPATKKRKQKT